MNKMLSCWLAVCLIVVPVVQAEEAEENDTQNPAAQNESKEGKDKERPADRKKEVFRPSEEISEDYAVAFPVDI